MQNIDVIFAQHCLANNTKRYVESGSVFGGETAYIVA